MKVYFCIVLAFIGSCVAFGKTADMSDSKYKSEYIIAIIVNKGGTIPSVNDGRPVSIDSLVEYKKETY